MSNLTTEEILWKCIEDIEQGNVLNIKEDPINGFLKSNNKNLTKKNVCDQSAKYNNGKPFSRPTLDSYAELSEYILNKKKYNNNDFLKEENKELKKKLELAQQVINQLKENNNNLAKENYKINELNKYLKEL